jgi:hypothetical protein
MGRATQSHGHMTGERAAIRVGAAQEVIGVRLSQRSPTREIPSGVMGQDHSETPELKSHQGVTPICLGYLTHRRYSEYWTQQTHNAGAVWTLGVTAPILCFPVIPFRMGLCVLYLS